jgi:PKD repeat protein
MNTWVKHCRFPIVLILIVALFQLVITFAASAVPGDVAPPLGEVDGDDVRWIVEHIRGLRLLDSSQFAAADVAPPYGVVDNTDVQYIVETILGLRELPQSGAFEGQVIVPPGSPLLAANLTVVTAASSSRVSSTGYVAVSAHLSPTQVVLVESANGNPVMLGYVFGAEVAGTAAASSALRRYSTATTPVEFSDESTALTLIMMSPYLIGAPPDKRVEFAEKAMAHASFPNLVNLIRTAIITNPETALSGYVHPDIYELAAHISFDVFNQLSELSSSNVFSMDLKPYNPTGGPWLEDKGRYQILLVNPKQLPYAVGFIDFDTGNLLGGFSENPLPLEARDFWGLFFGPYKKLQYLPDGRYKVDLYRWGNPFTGNPIERLAVILNLVEGIKNIIDIAIGIGDISIPLTSGAICLSELINRAGTDVINAIIQQSNAFDVIITFLDFIVSNSETIFLCLWETVSNRENIIKWHTKLAGILSKLNFAFKVFTVGKHVPYFWDLITAPVRVQYQIQQPAIGTDRTYIPYVHISVSPTSGSTSTLFQFVGENNDPSLCNLPVPATACSGWDRDPNEIPNLRYEWNFGDGSTSTQKNPSHRYTNEGTYTVTLRITDPDGAWAEDRVQIVVSGENIPPTAVARANPSSGIAPLLVNFDGTQSFDADGQIVAYRWDFGDGETAVGATTSHIYGTAGQYIATLTVTDNKGATGTDSVTINVAGQAVNDIRITLIWEKIVDMDLHVTTPSGEQIDYTHTIGATGCELDHDIINPADPEWTAPYQENITCQPGEAVRGTYKVGVNYYAPRGESGPVEEVRVVVRINEGAPNEIMRTFGPYTIPEFDRNCRDGCNPNAWWKVIEFDYPDGNFRPVSGGLPLSAQGLNLNKAFKDHQVWKQKQRQIWTQEQRVFSYYTSLADSDASRIVIEDKELQPDQASTISIFIENIPPPGLTLLQVARPYEIRFDPSIIQVTNITAVSPIEILQPIIIDNTEGRLQFIAIAPVGPEDQGIVGNAAILKIGVRAVGNPRQRTEVQITGFKSRLSDSTNLTVGNILNGTVTITERPSFLFSDKLEPSPLPGWQATGLWHLADNTSCASPGYSSPTHAWYYGSEPSCTHSGTGDLISPNIPIEGSYAYLILNFDYYLWLAKGERVELNVSFDNGRRWQRLSWRYSQGSWQPSGDILIRLPRGAASVMLKFAFRGRSPRFGDQPGGWLIDNIKLFAPLPLDIAACPPDGALGVPYSYTMTATGGVQPYSWSARGLPIGLRIRSSTGEIYGTPRRVGTSNVQITVRDATGSRVTKACTMRINPPIGALASIQPLSVSAIQAFPNPVSSEARFKVEGQGIASIQVEVYNLAGRKVFDSEEVLGNALDWQLTNDQGQPLANGVYLYIITVRGYDGQVIKSEVRKLVVLR